MSVVAPIYMPGYAGTVLIDSVAVAVQGWKAKDSVDQVDVSATGDGGWSSTERGLRSVEFTFTMAVKASGLPAFSVGNIYPVSFTVDGDIAYAGNVLITDASPTVDLKGAVTLDVTAKNHGALTLG